jgi:hypothetical protein
MWGQLAVGLFADGTANYSGLQVTGLFFGNVWQLMAQIIGTVICFVYVFGISWLFFKAYDGLFGIRVSPQTELAGLDVPELGGLAYPPDAEPSLVGIASAIPGAVWQQAQLDNSNQRPLPQALRIRSPQQSQAGWINPNHQTRPVNPNHQTRPVNPNHQEEGRNNPSLSGGNGQPEAWWQNQRNRPRRITLDADSKPELPG